MKKEVSIPASSKSFNPKKSIERARNTSKKSPKWGITISAKEYAWTTRMDRVVLVRKGLPYEAIEVLSKRSNLAVKQLLHALNLPQTTYNKKKKDQDLLNPRDTEVILVLTELLDFGLEVFNNENEKFQRWLKKPNISLGGVTPESLFDTLTGIQEVRNSLNRLEYGNMA